MCLAYVVLGCLNCYKKKNGLSRRFDIIKWNRRLASLRISMLLNFAEPTAILFGSLEDRQGTCIPMGALAVSAVRSAGHPHATMTLVQLSA